MPSEKDYQFIKKSVLNAIGKVVKDEKTQEEIKKELDDLFPTKDN